MICDKYRGKNTGPQCVNINVQRLAVHMKVPVHTKNGISGFLCWAHRILRFKSGGPSGGLVKGQDCTELMSGV
jgi:hypothetical protein